MGVLRVAWVISQSFCLHFALDKLWVSWHVVHYLLAWLAEASVDLKFLVGYPRSIWFLETFTVAHLIILILAWIVNSVTLDTWISCTVLTRSKPGLNCCRVTVNWVLATTSRSCLGPSKLLSSELTSIAVIMVNCDLLIPLLVLECLPYQRLVVWVHNTCISTLSLSYLINMGVAWHARLNASIWVLTRVPWMVTRLLMIDMEFGIWKLPTVHLIFWTFIHISGARWNVSRWVKRYQSVSPWTVASTSACWLRAHRSINPTVYLLTRIHHLSMCSMRSMSVSTSFLLEASMFETATCHVVLDHQRFLSMNSATLVVCGSIIVKLWMLLSNYLRVAALAVSW